MSLDSMKKNIWESIFRYSKILTVDILQVWFKNEHFSISPCKSETKSVMKIMLTHSIDSRKSSTYWENPVELPSSK